MNRVIVGPPRQPMPGLKLMLLGGFDVRLASGATVNVPRKKAQALLAYLGIRPGESHARAKLAALLWGETSDQQARVGLRQALAALRESLASAHPPPLRVEGGTLALDPEAIEVDVATFERWVAKGTPDALERAAEIYRGDLLLGVSLSEPLFEEWLVGERDRLREVALEAFARLLAHQEQSGGTERGIQTAVRLLALDPLQEAVHRSLMRLYVRQGRRGTALKQYQVCVAALERELGTEPEAKTRQLYQDLLRGLAPIPVQVADDPRPEPSPTITGSALVIPSKITSLIGREPELTRLRQVLEAASGGDGH